MPRQRSAVRYGTPLLLGTLMVLAALIALLHPLPARTANVAIAVKAPREVPQRAVESVDRTEGARQLAQRRLAVGDVSRVSFAVVDNATHEFVEWRLRNGAATITATSTSALCLGLARVFEQACGVTLLSWADASRPTKPCLATAADSHGRVSGLFRYRYAFNAVTFSYNFWRSESDWEPVLDWLALRGVNLALAHVGFESIFHRACQRVLGVDASRSFFTSDALFAWNRMGNIQGVGGPPSDALLSEQLRLQHWILRRMASLGIAPVLQGFNGFVPGEAVAKRATRMFDAFGWSGFTREASDVQRLPPSPLARQMAAAVAGEHLAEFADELAAWRDVFFSVDVFNENAPLVGEDLGKVAGDLVEPLRVAAAPARSARVVMQMWCFSHFREFWTRRRVHAFLAGFPRGSLVLLDLHGEHRPQWERLGLDAQWAKRTGNAVVWCVLHNFGGSNALGGEVAAVAAAARDVAEMGLAGIGIAPEGFGANELEYDTALRAAWSHQGGFGEEAGWVARWARARYRGAVDAPAAWECALRTVYGRPDYLRGFGPAKSVLEMRPANAMRHALFQPTALAYSPAELTACVRALLDANANANADAGAWVFDVVDWTRQALADAALLASERLDGARGDAAAAESAGRALLALIDAMGEVLRMDVAHFGGFEGMDAARRRLVTVWWDSDNDGALNAYASRQWLSLLPLYASRWRAFVRYLAEGGQAPAFDAIERAFVSDDAWWSARPQPLRLSRARVMRALALADAT